LNRLPPPASNKIYADLTATRSSVVLCPEGTGTPLAVTYLGSSEKSGITEAELQAAIWAGARIHRVLVVYRHPDKAPEPGDKPFVPCIRFASTAEWRVLRTQRRKSSRGFANFQAMLGYLAKKGWRGRTWVVRDDDPMLDRLPGITAL
jgi:hypothetical protein